MCVCVCRMVNEGCPSSIVVSIYNHTFAPQQSSLMRALYISSPLNMRAWQMQSDCLAVDRFKTNGNRSLPALNKTCAFTRCLPTDMQAAQNFCFRFCFGWGAFTWLQSDTGVAWLHIPTLGLTWLNLPVLASLG